MTEDADFPSKAEYEAARVFVLKKLSTPEERAHLRAVILYAHLDGFQGAMRDISAFLRGAGLGELADQMEKRIK